MIAAFLCAGCYPFGAPGIQPDSMVLPRGTRVLIAEAVAHGFGYTIIPLRRPVSLSGLTVVVPSRNGAHAIRIGDLIPAVVAEKHADMVFILRPHAAVERGYDPFPFLKGWYPNTIQEGRVNRTTQEPVYETRYKFTCTRITYHVYQYDAQARLRGVARIQPEGLRQCPETSQADVHLDEYESAVAWLKTNIRIK